MSLIGKLHNILVFKGRVSFLSNYIGQLLPPNSKILDVGCGDGLIDSLIMKDRPDLSILGIDILVRARTHISVAEFDGNHFPFATGSFDIVMFNDVLHHTNNQKDLLLEAKRVAKQGIVIKDHITSCKLDNLALKLMDWVGNAHIGVTLPYNYFTEDEWFETISRLGLEVDYWNKSIPLYSWPLSIFFNRSLHLVTRLLHRNSTINRLSHLDPSCHPTDNQS